jgi:hypothetical protein
MMLIDNGEKIVDIPDVKVEGEKSLKDGSTRFKLIGGPYHDMMVRHYPPYGAIKFPHPTEGDLWYELTPGFGKNRTRWAYVYNPARTSKQERFQ